MKTLITTVATLLAGVAMQAQTFHAIVFCNTIDRSIGDNMKVELANVSRNLAVLEKLLEQNYDFSITQIDGPDCTRENLKATIDDLNVEPDDVIFAFYGGHGSHAMNNSEDPWPQFCMNTGDQSKWVPMALVDKWVAAKNPRLSIVMANCCNKEQLGVTVKPMWANDERATSLSGLNPEAFRKLFSAKGRVMSTSSRLGQLSWCNPYGGVFTNQFWGAMERLGKGQISPEWDALLAEASAELTINSKEGLVKQNPYYRTYLNGKTPVARKRPDNGSDTGASQGLQAMLSRLVDKSISQERRLAMIPDIMRRHFPMGSMVYTIASDMVTSVDREDAEAFLYRICLSDFVSGIAVLNADTRKLQVHEIH